MRFAGMYGIGTVAPQTLVPYLDQLLISLSEEGFPTARLDSLVHSYTDKGFTIDIFLDESYPVILRNTQISGNIDPPMTPLSTGNALSHALLQAKSTEILNQLTEQGFPFAKVTVKPGYFTVEDSTIAADLDLQIDPGPYVRLSQVNFSGLKLTTPKLLRLESRLKRGMVFQRSQVIRASRRIEKLSFITRVGKPEFIPVSSGIVNVEFPVSERSVNRISGLLSIDQGSKTPAGELELEFGNILGTGRIFRFAWLGLNQSRRGLKISYREPWLFNLPVHIDLALENWNQDSSVTVSDYSGAAHWEPVDRLNLTGTLRSESIKQNIHRESESSSQALWLGAGLSYDYLDDTWNPTDGYQLEFHSEHASRHWEDPAASDRSLRRESTSGQAAQMFWRQWIGYGRIGIQDVSGSGVVREDLVRIGGTGSIRGYIEEEFLARGAAWGTLEWRWRPDSDGYVGFMTDVGSIYREDFRVRNRKKELLSYGITIAILTRAGNLGVDIALPADEPLQRARLHVRLNGWF